MNKQRGNALVFFLAGVCFVTVSMLVVVGYFFYQNLYQGVKSQEKVPVSLQKASGKDVPWKTLSSIYGYSIDYPADWFVHLATPERQGSLDQIESYDSSKITSPGQSGFGKNQTKLEIGKDSQVYDLSGVEERLSLEKAAYLSKEKTTLSGKPALKITQESPGGKTTTIFVADQYPTVYFIAIYGDLSGDNQKIIDHMISSFNFMTGKKTTDAVPSSSVDRKVLPYFLPSGWSTVQSRDGRFEIGFDPTKNQLFGEEATRSGISFTGIWSTTGGQVRNLGNRYSFAIKPYDGGSRHNFLYRELSFKPFGTNFDDTPGDNFEREYSVQGWPCLVIFGIDISQWTQVWGVCPISSTEAISFNMDGDEKMVQQILQTVRLVK